MDQHVSDPDVKACMAVFSPYYGLPPEELNALFYAIATGEYLVLGGQYYKARSQDLSRTLAQGLQNFGGRIRYNTRAEQILFSPDNTITGVKDHQGTVYPAKAVVANCPVPALVNTLVPPEVLPASFAAQARQRQPSLSSFVVWLGLNQTLPGITDYEIDLAGSAGAPGNHLFKPADLAESGIGITVYDNLFRGYSAEGKTSLTLICLSDYARWQKYETDYFNNRKKAYHREKERIAARFIQRVEKALIPGLSGMIEEMEIGTPLTNVFYTGNTGGAIYGYDRNRPHLESGTPVKGLYLASAWSHGGGYTPVMMGGRQTALQVIRGFQGSQNGLILTGSSRCRFFKKGNHGSCQFIRGLLLDKMPGMGHPDRSGLGKDCFPTLELLFPESDIFHAPDNQRWGIFQNRKPVMEGLQPGGCPDDLPGKHQAAFPVFRQCQGVEIVGMNGRGQPGRIPERFPHDASGKEIVPANQHPADGTAHKPAERDVVGIPVHRPGPGVQNDEAGDIVRVGRGIGQSDGAAPVLHHQGDLLQTQPLNQPGQVGGMVFRQIGPGQGFVGQAEPQVIHGDTPVIAP